MDVSEHLVAKSDQLNNIDLIAGDIVITVTKVTVKPKGSEQPIWIHYEGDDGKPWKPCKNMMRVISGIWTSNSALWVGRKLRIYRDPEVTFGKMTPGGVRISEMSNMQEEKTFVLQFKRGLFAPFTVKPLVVSTQGGAPAPVDLGPIKAAGEKEAAKGAAALGVWWSGLGGAMQNKLGVPFKDQLKAAAAAADQAKASASSGQPADDEEGIPL